MFQKMDTKLFTILGMYNIASGTPSCSDIVVHETEITRQNKSNSTLAEFVSYSIRDIDKLLYIRMIDRCYKLIHSYSKYMEFISLQIR